MSFIDYSCPLEVGVEWLRHPLSRERSLVEGKLDLEPRLRNKEEIVGLVLPVEIDASSVRWEWLRTKYNRVDAVGANGYRATLRRGEARGLRWTTVGSSVELTAFDGGRAAATVYAAQPRVATPRFRVDSAGAFRMLILADWPDEAPLPSVRFFRMADHSRRLEEIATERFTRRDGALIAASVPNTRERIYGAVTDSSGQLLHATVFTEHLGAQREIGLDSAERTLISDAVSSRGVSSPLLPWPERSRVRFEVLKRRLIAGKMAGYAGNLGETRDGDVTRAYRIALLHHFGVQIEDSVLADMNRDDFGAALSLLLSGVDVHAWPVESIVWAMKSRSLEAYRPVVRMFPRAEEAQRALPLWNELQAAATLLDRFASDSPGRIEVSRCLDALRSYIGSGGEKPGTTVLAAWKKRLDDEDQDPLPAVGVHHSAEAGKVAAINEQFRSEWFGSLGTLLVEWLTGNRAPRRFEQEEIEKLLPQIESPPFPNGGDVDPWMRKEAERLQGIAINRHDPLVQAALQKLNDVVITDADRCSRFHSVVRTAEATAKAHVLLRERLSFDRSLSMTKLAEHAEVVAKLVRNAEAKAGTLGFLAQSLNGTPIMDVLLLPSHPAVTTIRAEHDAKSIQYQDLCPGVTPIPDFSDVPGDGLEALISAWWAHLTALERALQEAEDQLRRLQLIARTVWSSLETRLLRSMGVARNTAAGRRWVAVLEPLVRQAQAGDLHAPKEICRILVEHPQWSRPLEDPGAMT